MYGLSEQPWSSEVDLSKLLYVQSTGRNVEKTVAIITGMEAPGLQPGHVILALYESVLAMYSRRPGFYSVVVTVHLQGRYIGRALMIAPYASQTMFDSQNRTILGDDMFKHTSSVTADSGVFVDPEDSRFRISWTFDGRSVPAQEIFSAVLDGIMTIAQYGIDVPCAYVTGVSFSGNVAFHVGRVDGQGLLCGQMSRVFLAIPHWIIMIERKFTEMDFTLEYAGRKIATGYIFKVSSVASQDKNSTGKIAAS